MSVIGIPGLCGRRNRALCGTERFGVPGAFDAKVDTLGVAGSDSMEATPAGIFDGGTGESSIVERGGSWGMGEGIGRAWCGGIEGRDTDRR